MSEKEKKVRELSAEEVLQKFDKESDKRELTGVWGKIISAICILFALFQLYIQPPSVCWTRICSALFT